MHMVAHDRDARATLQWVLMIAPLRFAIDVVLLGPTNFGIALFSATMYILCTFVATHQAGEVNHTFETTDCWMVRQLRATNNVWPHSRLWSFLCGGINLHIEHHLFPQISNDQLHHIAPVVEEFARKHRLPYNTFSPVELVKQHASFLKGEPIKD
jgi:linoleoyl-CoA desaturase